MFLLWGGRKARFKVAVYLMPLKAKNLILHSNMDYVIEIHSKLVSEKAGLVGVSTWGSIFSNIAYHQICCYAS